MTLGINGDLGFTIDDRKYYEENNSATFNGVPQLPTTDGSIIESGSNANGTYIKYADGTMICSIVLSTYTIAGNANSPTISWIYPAQFGGNLPVITGSAGQSFSVSSSDCSVLFDLLSGANTLSGTRVLLQNKSSSSRDLTGHLQAIGRWRA